VLDAGLLQTKTRIKKNEKICKDKRKERLAGFISALA
jgi:hypothetical protein